MSCSTVDGSYAAELREQLLDRVGDVDRIVPGGDRDRDVAAVRVRYDDLGEVAVAHDHVPEPAAIDLAALAGQQEQGRIDQQFLVAIRVARGRVAESGALLQQDVRAVGDGDVADVVAQREGTGQDLVGVHPTGAYAELDRKSVV